MSSVRPALRTWKRRILSFRKAHPPIAIFGLRRGGTSMVADAMAISDGVWFCDEPYAVFPDRAGYETRNSALPSAPHSHFFALPPDELAQFRTYTETLLGAGYRNMGTCRRTRPGLRADRVCLKVLNAPWMIDWFEAETDVQPVVVLRHPGAQALSVLRQGWDFPIRAYARRPDALRTHFTPDQIGRIEALAAGPAGWELALLDWIVTSAPLRAHAARKEAWSYESIVSDPGRFVREILVDRLGLSSPARMQATFDRPSGSSKMSEGETNAMIRDGQSSALLQRWRAKVDAAQLKAGQDLLEEFGVTGYSFVDP